jgi:hypothetical protein
MQKFIIIFLLLAVPVRVWSQATALLNKSVNLSVTNELVSTVLNRISQQGQFSFSYNASLVADDRVVTLNVVNKPVREVLNEIFRGSVTYKEKGNHVILTKVPVKPSGSTSSVLIISGYVEDIFTNEKITAASVYEKKSITSVVSDEFGFFRLKLDKNPEIALEVSISKRDYADTTIAVTANGNQYIHISLRPLHRKATIAEPDTADISLAAVDPALIEPEVADTIPDDELNLPFTENPNIENISDTLYREFQVSLFPFIGTNGALSGNVVNGYSFNIFGGYGLGTKQVEVGGFFNVDRGDASWLQVAGFFNMVGRNMTGVQTAGFFNLNGGYTNAVQVSGFTNINFKRFEGVQLTGFANINLGAADGFLAAGFMNYSDGPSVGAEVAGFMNVHDDDFTGPQVAGFGNFNYGTLRGSQVAGFMNVGGKVYGTQIGVLNIADSLSGVPIGILSIVRQGYHKIELSGDEIFYANLAFRSGVRQFYNILSVGAKPDFDSDSIGVWQFGYGVGSSIRLARWLDLNLDITSHHVNKGSFTPELSSLNKLHLGFDWRLTKKFSIYTGATLNGYFTQTSFSDYPRMFTDFYPTMVTDRTYDNGVNLKMWWGAKVGLRFL